MRLSEVYAKSYTSLSSVINIFPDFVNAPLKLFNLVDNLSHAESAENTELHSSSRWFTLALDSTDWALVSRCLPGGGVTNVPV